MPILVTFRRFKYSRTMTMRSVSGMTTFSRSYPDNAALVLAADAWADDLLEVDPERLGDCFALASSLHANLGDDALRFPLTAAEVRAAWRAINAAERVRRLRETSVCAACQDTRQVQSYDPVRRVTLTLPCPYHVA